MSEEKQDWSFEKSIAAVRELEDWRRETRQQDKATMTNKHYNWMTPEEAAKELQIGEFVWAYDGEIQPGIFEVDPNGRPCIEIADYSLPLRLFKKICRAIVPEVPNE